MVCPYLFFSIPDRTFGLRYDSVKEVTNQPPLTRILKTPRWLEGVFLHRDGLAPVINLSRLVKSDEVMGATPLLLMSKIEVADKEVLIGLGITEVHGWANIDIENAESMVQAQPGQFSSALYVYQGQPVEILSIEKVVRHLSPSVFDEASSAVSLEPIELSSVKTQNHNWAIRTGDIVEFRKAENIQPDDSLPEYAVGAFRSREEWIPVIDLEARMNDTKAKPVGPRDGLLIIRGHNTDQNTGLTLGLLAEDSRPLGQVPPSFIRRTPLLRNLPGRQEPEIELIEFENEILEIVRGDLGFDEETLTRLKNWRHLITELTRIASLTEGDFAESQLTNQKDEEHFVIGEASGALFAIPSEYVRTIVSDFKVVDFLALDTAEDKRVIIGDKSGKLVDLRTHFGLQKNTPVELENSRVTAILVETPKSVMALAVDKALSLISLPQKPLLPARRFPHSIHPDLIHGCLETEYGLCAVIDFERLVNDKREPLYKQLRKLLGESPYI